MTKISFCFLPKRLAEVYYPSDEICYPKLRWIGWIWMKRAVLTYNMKHGWVAFLDDQAILKK